jgi:hypothetical protein
MNHFSIRRGQTRSEAGYKITLLGYGVPPDVDAQVAKGIVPDIYPVTAFLRVNGTDGKANDISAVNTRYKDDPVPALTPEKLLPRLGGGAAQEALAFEGMDPDTGKATFYVRQADSAPFTAFTIEVSTRPTIGLVWLGTLFLFIGGLMSMARRAGENRLMPIADPVGTPTGGKPLKQSPDEPQPAHRRL